MDRSCTDVFMCLIFFVFFCGMFATAAYGYYKGDPTKLINPYDSSGKKDSFFLYFFNRKLMWW